MCRGGNATISNSRCRGARRFPGLFAALNEGDHEVDVGGSSPPAFVGERDSPEDVQDSSMSLQTGQRDKLDIGAARASSKFYPPPLAVETALTPLSRRP